jgi:hypothetical protein
VVLKRSVSIRKKKLNSFRISLIMTMNSPSSSSYIFLSALFRIIFQTFFFPSFMLHSSYTLSPQPSVYNLSLNEYIFHSAVMASIFILPFLV